MFELTRPDRPLPPFPSISATSLLKQDYKETMNIAEATELLLKVMSKTMDTTKLGSEKRCVLFPLSLSLSISVFL